MVIRLTKGWGDKPGVLTCVRDDGSCTWQRSSDFFARHDLIHYAVETTLGCRDAFLGLVARGRDLDSFGTRGGVKDVYTPEEGWAEGLVGVLQWPSLKDGLRRGEPAVPFDEMIRHFPGGSAPPITPAQWTQIHAAARALHDRWDGLAPGESMELIFGVLGQRSPKAPRFPALQGLSVRRLKSRPRPTPAEGASGTPPRPAGP